MTNQISCSEIDRALDRGLSKIRRSMSQEERSHVAECARCDTLLRTLEDHSEPKLPKLTFKRVEDALLLTLHPVRPLPPAWVFLAMVMMIFLSLVAMGTYQLGPFGWNMLSALQKAAIASSLAASASLLGFAMVAQMVPGSKQRIAPALLPIGAFVLLVICIAGVFQYERDPDFVRAGMGCLTTGIPYAIPAALLFFLILRQGIVLRPLLSGAVSGMLAGLIGTSVLEVHCTILDVRHILVWHLGVCIVGASFGLLACFLGSSLRKVRARLRLLET